MIDLLGFWLRLNYFTLSGMFIDRLDGKNNYRLGMEIILILLINFGYIFSFAVVKLPST